MSAATPCQFGATLSHINKVVLRKTWKHLQGDEHATRD